MESRDPVTEIRVQERICTMVEKRKKVSFYNIFEFFAPKLLKNFKFKNSFVIQCCKMRHFWVIFKHC